MMKRIAYLLLMMLLPLMASANDDIVVRGDANGDGVVSMPDATAIMNNILGTTDTDFNKEAADANLDGVIGMPDVMFVINYIMKGKFPGAVMPQLKISFEGELSKDMTDYVNGSMQLTDANGNVVELPAGFKTRGATAKSYSMKPALNMKLFKEDYTEEADSSLLEMRSCSSWILDAMAIDRICMRNRVAFDIWNEFSRLPYATDFEGRNGTEGQFVELFINNQYYGIYCLNDKINRKLLDLKKVQEKDGVVTIRGALYKSGTNDIADQNNPGYNEDSTACVIKWHDAWELSYPDDYGCLQAWKPLQDAILTGNNKDYVKKYFFLENLADYQIHVMALAISDNWGNKNHYLSVRNITKDINDPDTTEANRRRFVLTPWDLDTSFGGAYNGSCYGGNYLDWPVSAASSNAPYPISPIVDDLTYQAILRDRWLVARAGAFSIDSINAKLERYRDLFIQSGAWQRMTDYFEARSAKPKYVLDLAEEIALIEAWYADRFSEMDRYFNVTALEEMHEEPADNMLYDLMGHKIGTIAPGPGMYIRGRRVVIITQ